MERMVNEDRLEPMVSPAKTELMARTASMDLMENQDNKDPLVSVDPKDPLDLLDPPGQLDRMELDQKVFTWFTAHDWDEDTYLDGLELIKALSHDHNYHHPSEENIPDNDEWHDTAQHTEPAERQRLRRSEKIVDKILEEDDSDKDGLVSFPEFMSALHAGKLDGLKIRKTK